MEYKETYLMMPNEHEHSARKTVLLVTYIVIALNVVLFVIGLKGNEAAIMEWAFLPNRLLPISLDNYLTMLMSIICMPGGYTWKAICSEHMELRG